MSNTNFSGGDKLEAYLKKMAAKVSVPALLQVGFKGGTYPDGTSVASVAAFNEFGVPARNQPPRPFFRNMIAAKNGEWPGQIAKLLKSTDYDSVASMETMGEVIADELRDSINELTSPRLADSTAKAKGFDKPLIDTHQMLDSVDKWVVTT